MNAMNPERLSTEMCIEEMKTSIRNHFGEFANRKNLDIADVHFAQRLR